jgi:hypothetical protein
VVRTYRPDYSLPENLSETPGQWSEGPITVVGLKVNNFLGKWNGANELIRGFPGNKCFRSCALVSATANVCAVCYMRNQIQQSGFSRVVPPDDNVERLNALEALRLVRKALQVAAHHRDITKFNHICSQGITVPDEPAG